jgi:rhomboid protease GluP
MIRALLIVNISFYVLSLIINPFRSGFSFNPLNALSPDNMSLFLLGATGTIPIDYFAENLMHMLGRTPVENFPRFWTLLSANYLHGNVFHLIFNMVALWYLAPLVSRYFGFGRMFVIYTLGGVTGFTVSYLAGNHLTLGASAAVCALIGAVFYYSRSSGSFQGQMLFKLVGVWAVALLVMGFLLPGIDNWAHGGGLIGGTGVAFLIKHEENQTENALHKALARICLVLTGAVLIWAVGSGFYYRISAL